MIYNTFFRSITDNELREIPEGLFLENLKNTKKYII